MNRREFTAVVSGAAVAWPFAVRARQAERIRLIGVLQVRQANDAQAARNVAMFKEELQKSGWTEGKNIRFEIRRAAGDISRIRQFAKELVGLKPDAVLVASTAAAVALAAE